MLVVTVSGLLMQCLAGPSIERKAAVAANMRFVASHCRSVLVRTPSGAQAGQQSRLSRTYESRTDAADEKLQQMACFCLGAWCKMLAALQAEYECGPAVPVLLHILQVNMNLLQAICIMATRPRAGLHAPGWARKAGTSECAW